MGFLQTIKQKLGIGGVSVNLAIPTQVERHAGTLAGKIMLTTKSDQEVLNLSVKMIEKWSVGKSDAKTVKEFTWGEMKLPGGFTIKPGEMKEIPFSLAFNPVSSENDKFKDKGGAMKTLGKVGSFLDGEHSEFRVVADASVKGVALGPSKTINIKVK